MTTYKSLLVVANPDHPFFNQLSKAYRVKSLDEALNSFETYDTVIDLSALRTQKKFLFLKELSKTSKATIISDLSLCWGEWIFKYCPQVKAAVSSLFFSPNNSMEYSLSSFADGTESKIITELAQTCGLNIVEHKNLGLTFHYPRTVAMIINEAYFALEEKLASAQDIDLAMKNGVNYPLGPIEWGDKIGLSLVAQLLDELHTITKDDRYRLSTHLKLNALKNL